jgi:Fur family ferric uptake transcriptional regulator
MGRARPARPADAPGEQIIEPLCAVFRRKLRGEGLKYTPERATVLDAVAELDGAFEADEVLAMVRGRGHRVSKATIYRTIKLLQDAGIVQRVLTGDDQALYLMVFGRRPHDLIIRLDTREMIPVDLPDLVEIRDRVCRERGLIPRGHRLQVFAVGAVQEDGSASPAAEKPSLAPASRSRTMSA